MRYIDPKEFVAVAVVEAIQTGDLATLKRLLTENPDLALARLGDADPAGMSRTLLHIATDWPGHFPKGAETVAALIEAGAAVNARFSGPHTETPLHWAASSNDIPVLDALLDAGADMEAPGAVIAGGTALADATAFGNWEAARRLVQRGAHVDFFQAATLGLVDRLEGHFAGASGPGPEAVNRAFWGACHGGQQLSAEYLVERGADLNWLPDWEPLTPLDAAQRSGAGGLVTWLRGRGAQSARAVID